MEWIFTQYGLIILLGIVLIIFFSIKVLYIFFKKTWFDTRRLFIIWLIGLVVFLVGILGQIQQIKMAFQAVEMAHDISPALVASAISESYIYSQIGLVIFILSLIIWGILKMIIISNGSNKAKIA